MIMHPFIFEEGTPSEFFGVCVRHTNPGTFNITGTELTLESPLGELRKFKWRELNQLGMVKYTHRRRLVRQAARLMA